MHQCKALHDIFNRPDVESFGGALEQLNGNFSDIGAHKDFQMPEFFLPELLLKELWVQLTCMPTEHSL